MNLEQYSALKPYTTVAAAMETTLDENDELDGAFIWVVYHNDSTHLFVGRVDVMAGTLREFVRWQYRDARDYAEVFAAAMALLYERATGRDFCSAAPRR